MNIIIIICLVLLIYLIILIKKLGKKYSNNIAIDNEYKIQHNKKVDIMLKKIDNINKDSNKIKNLISNGK